VQIQTATSNGRTLTFAEWGDRDGFPVFTLHGTPGSRLLRHYDESKYAQVGARVITYDRPGYGGSDRSRGRGVVDCVADVAAIADTLGVERFPVTGGSGGGPHALAVAARLPDRVTRASCEVGIVPYPTPDFDWFEGMDPLNVKEFGWALELAEIRVPTRIVYGVTDVLSPRQHGEWLGRNVPNAQVVIEDESGHLPDPAVITERFGWLVQQP